MGNVYGKMILILGWSVLVFYDEDDNFKDKRYILISYDYTKPMSEKIKRDFSKSRDFANIEKASLNEKVGTTTPEYFAQATPEGCLSQSTAAGVNEVESLTRNTIHPFSECKDTSNLSDGQRFSEEIIEKAKKSSPIGTEKTWGGKIYVKTEKGWKPKGKGGKKTIEEESSKNQSSKDSLNKQAALATDKQLKAAINDPEASLELKKVAQEELSKRNKQQDSDDESNKQSNIEDAYKRLLEAQEKGELELDQDVLDKIQEKLEESKKKNENEEGSIDNPLAELI